MIKPFQYFISENLVKKSLPNTSMAKSLLQKAEIRLSRISKNEMNEEESSIIFEEVYECLREASQALLELKGYKPYLHEAILSFLKEEKYLSEATLNTLDNYRIIRNNSVYKAERVSISKCVEAIEFTKKVLPKIKIKFEELIT